MSFEYEQISIISQRPRKIKKDFDTIICPAHEWGIEEVFLKKRKWHAIRLNPKNIPKIKYIALYETRRKSIRYIGKIKEIKPYENSGKFQFLLEGKPTLITPIKRSKKNPHLAPQNRVFTKIDFFKNARFLEDVCYNYKD